MNALSCDYAQFANVYAVSETAFLQPTKVSSTVAAGMN